MGVKVESGYNSLRWVALGGGDGGKERNREQELEEINVSFGHIMLWAGNWVWNRLIDRIKCTFYSLGEG